MFTVQVCSNHSQRGWILSAIQPGATREGEPEGEA